LLRLLLLQRHPRALNRDLRVLGVAHFVHLKLRHHALLTQIVLRLNLTQIDRRLNLSVHLRLQNRRLFTHLNVGALNFLPLIQNLLLRLLLLQRHPRALNRDLRVLGVAHFVHLKLRHHALLTQIVLRIDADLLRGLIRRTAKGLLKVIEERSAEDFHVGDLNRFEPNAPSAENFLHCASDAIAHFLALGNHIVDA